MKKFMLISAFVIGLGVTAQAQDKPVKTKTETTSATTKTTSKQYTAIDRNTVSPQALEKIGTRYGGYAIEEAHRASDGEYKLILSKDGSRSTTYFSTDGEFIREE